MVTLSRRFILWMLVAAACGRPGRPPAVALVTDEDAPQWPGPAAGYVADESGRIDPADESTVDIFTVSP